MKNRWQAFLDSLDSSGGHIFIIVVMTITLMIMWSVTKAPTWERFIDVFVGALLMYISKPREKMSVNQKLLKALAIISQEKDGGISTTVADQARDALTEAGYKPEELL